MLIFLDLDPESTLLSDGAMQIGANLATAAGTASARAHPVEPAELRRAALAFLSQDGGLGEMFRPAPVGTVDHVAVSPGGAVRLTASVTDPAAIRKVRRGVLRVVGVAVRVLGRSQDDLDIVTAAEVIGVSLVDRPDDGFRLAKAAPAISSPYAAAMATVAAMGDDILDMSARLGRYERTPPREAIAR